MSEVKDDLKYLSIDDIVPNSWNPNVEDDKSFNMLMEDVANTGFIDSITVVPIEDGKYQIIGGEHRWRAARASGQDEIPCLILMDDKWKSDELKKFVTVRMNMIRGKLDPEKFVKLYDEVADKYNKDELQKLFGFIDTRAFDKALKGTTSAMKKALPESMHGELEEKAKDAKSVDDLALIVQEMFAKHGDTVAQSFMVFTYGKQEHIYISMSNKLRKTMDKIMLYCETYNKDINGLLNDNLREVLDNKIDLLNGGE